MPEALGMERWTEIVQLLRHQRLQVQKSDEHQWASNIEHCGFLRKIHSILKEVGLGNGSEDNINKLNTEFN